jgi:hypothetical protein
MTSDFVADVEQICTALEAQQASFQQECQKLLHKTFSAFFAACPSVKALYWRQYTPSFNDGDPCVFTVNDITFANTADRDTLEKAVNEEDLENCYADDGTEAVAMETWSDGFSRFFPEKPCKALSAFVSSMEKASALEAAFGTNVSVLVTREGFTVDEYECGY